MSRSRGLVCASSARVVSARFVRAVRLHESGRVSSSLNVRERWRAARARRAAPPACSNSLAGVVPAMAMVSSSRYVRRAVMARCRPVRPPSNVRRRGALICWRPAAPRPQPPCRWRAAVPRVGWRQCGRPAGRRSEGAVPTRTDHRATSRRATLARCPAEQPIARCPAAQRHL